MCVRVCVCALVVCTCMCGCEFVFAVVRILVKHPVSEKVLPTPSVYRRTRATHYALVIGNNSRGLKLCKKDAKSMKALFERKGYKVALVTNATAASMEAALDALVAALPTECTVVVFFAGHGVTDHGRTVLLGIDGESSPFVLGSVFGVALQLLSAAGFHGVCASFTGLFD